MSPVEIAYPVHGQQAQNGPLVRREGAEPTSPPRARSARTDGAMPPLSARLSRLALAQRQHHQGWR